MSAADPERDPPELEALLGHAEPARPRPEARAEARRAFLAGGASRADSSRPRVDPRTGDMLLEDPSEPEDGFAAWLAARALVPQPSPPARRRAQLAFLSEVASVQAPPPPSRGYRAIVWLAAAAAIVLVTFLVPEPDRWRVVLDGQLALDEETFGPGEEDRLAAELESSGWIESQAERVRFTLAGALELELAPGSSLHFPPLPELDGLRPLDFELARGEAYLRTLASYPGNPILVHTDGADVALSGTTVGILVDGAGTCVCVAEGTARVTSARGSEDVSSLRTLRLGRDGSQEPERAAFDTTGSGPAALHVQELLVFHRGR